MSPSLVLEANGTMPHPVQPACVSNVLQLWDNMYSKEVPLITGNLQTPQRDHLRKKNPWVPPSTLFHRKLSCMRSSLLVTGREMTHTCRLLGMVGKKRRCCKVCMLLNQHVDICTSKPEIVYSNRSPKKGGLPCHNLHFLKLSQSIGKKCE